MKSRVTLSVFGPFRAGGFLCATILLLAAGSPLQAQDRIPSPYEFIDTNQEIGVYGALLSPDAGQLGLGMDSGSAFGAWYEISFGGAVSLELMASYYTGTRKLFNPDADGGERVVGEVDQNAGSADVRLKWHLNGARTWHRTSPYLFLGGGALFGLGDRDPIEEELIPLEANRFSFDTSFSLTSGAGVKVFLTDRINLRIDGTFALWKIETPSGIFNDEDFLQIPADESTANFILRFGLGYRF